MNIKSLFVKRIKCDNIGPGGIWGFVRYEDYKNTRLFAPIPLNFLWAFGSWLYAWMAWRATWFFLDRMPPTEPSPAWVKHNTLTDEDLERISREPGIITVECCCNRCGRETDENNDPVPLYEDTITFEQPAPFTRPSR